jgi:hypothetical protein
MATSLFLKFKGLFTNSNELSSVPDGALITAENIDILSENLAQPRRGFGLLADSTFGDADTRIDSMWTFGNELFAHNSADGIGEADTISRLTSGAWSDYSGTFEAPSGHKIRPLFANQNTYLNTSDGIKKLDSNSGTIVDAGGYKGLDISASASASVSTWLADDYRTAYRCVWGIKDANNNLVLGAPSQRESFVNTTGSAKAIDLRITIPAGVTTDWFVQLYRAAAVDNSSSDTEPSDEMGLVYEISPTSGNITAGYIDITDITPDELRGATIYTAASQEGLANSNEAPPLAKDMAVFRDCTFFVNTISKHRYTMTLLAVSGSGLVNDDTITIGGVVYTGKATETIASAQFAVVTGGSASQNIRDTAISLIRVINRHASSTVYAYYLSSVDDLPGKILIEERGIGGNSFAVISSRGSAFNPTLPSSGTTESSTNDTYVNGAYFSKPNQNEHVPLVNFLTVGSKNREILRAVALRDSLILLKEDGIYRITGYYPSFNVELLDSSAIIIGKETPAILNNVIYCLSSQGIVAIGDSVTVISIPIEDQIREKVAAFQSSIESRAFGVAYESERRYYLFWPSTSGSTFSDEALVFNSYTRTFVTHSLSASTAYVDAVENTLYLAPADSAIVKTENRTYSQTDHGDYLREDAISVISALDITLSDSTNVEVGDVIYQSDTVYSYITSISGDVATVQTDPGFTVAACTIFKAIATSIKWAPITFGNPAHMKQFNSLEVLFKSDFNGTAYIYFESDLDQNLDVVEIEGEPVGLWGSFEWGGAPWGGQPVRRPYRIWVPRSKQRSSQLSVNFQHKIGFSLWEMEGISISGEMGSEKTNR